MAKYDVAPILKQVDPCPHCGTPRVGIDEDDFYRVVPGTLSGDCKCDFCNSSYILEYGDVLFAPESGDVKCPKCGHTVHVKTEKKWGNAYVTRHCDHKITLKELPGCPKCKDSAQWPF